MKKYFLFILLCSLVSCTHNLSPRLDIVNDQKLQFSGKAAGAGMMLSSTMGPMGMAIGFAIDEGIAKDIRGVAEANNIVIEKILLSRIKKQGALSKLKPSSVIHIDRFGFISWPGEGDAVMSQLHITVKHVSGREFKLKFPEDFSLKGKSAPSSAQLDVIKKQGEDVRRLLSYAADQIASRLN